MLKLFKCKKGMTLVEMVAGMILFSITTAAVIAIVIPIMNVYSRANELAEYNTLLENIANHMTSDLSQAIENPVIDNINKTISIEIDSATVVEYTLGADGTLCRNDPSGNPYPVLAKEFYKNKSVTFDCNDNGNGTFNLRLTVSSDRTELAVSREYAIKPLALEANQFLAAGPP